MKDVQNTPDSRKIPIRKVGIKDLRHPITVLDRANESQHTIATVNMYVDLPHEFKGTHMSRFIDIISHYHGNISVHAIAEILSTMIERFDSETAHLEIHFPYFIEKTAPVSGATSMMDYDCAFIAAMERGQNINTFDLKLEAAAPVTTLCPCSKEISEGGAHNQRSRIVIQARSRELVWLEDLIEIAESAASAPLFALLKREDEKWVTEHAYQNPTFVEDVVRSVAVRLEADTRVSWYQVSSENFESIHNHSAYALVTGPQSERHTTA